MVSLLTQFIMNTSDLTSIRSPPYLPCLLRPPDHPVTPIPSATIDHKLTSSTASATCIVPYTSTVSLVWRRVGLFSPR